MSQLTITHKATIGRRLRRNTPLHLYELGDLDDFFWPHTRWYGHPTGPDTVLLYTAADPPVLLALTEPPFGAMADLLRELLPTLPPRLYAHFSGSLVEVLAQRYRPQTPHLHQKMILPAAELPPIDTQAACPLTEADLPQLEALYRVSYPDNAFDARMLQTGCFFGIWREGQLLSAAGIHVYSRRYSVAALGNVVTHPQARWQGLATIACAKLIHTLRAQGIRHIGLNVKADNAAAIRCYRRLGFTPVADYWECGLEANS